jgi:hypothetical protein
VIENERFPYEKYDRWSQKLDQRKHWTEELEQAGTENVRAQLALSGVSSGGDLIGIGPDPITKGFAQQWLAWHDARRRAEDERRQNQIYYWTRAAAIGALIAALATVASAFVDLKTLFK